MPSSVNRFGAIFGLVLLLGAVAVPGASAAVAVNPFAPSSPDPIPVIGGTAFVACTLAASGRELWTTDGTLAGTTLLKDIAPGPASSEPWALTGAGPKVFFTADDGSHGRELWVSDGSAGGTILLQDIAPGAATSAPDHLIAAGARVFFTAFEPGVGRTLWTSDGTPSGTVRVQDLDPAPAADEYSYNWHHVFCAVGSELYFNGIDPVRGSTLWKSDGTALGTVLVKDVIASQPGGTPVAMTAFAGKLFYVSRGDNRLWSSDGSDGGTALFSTAIINCDFPTGIGGLLYVRGTTGGFSNGIWATDGDPASLVQVSTDFSAPGWFVGMGGAAFMAPDAPAGLSYRPLVRSDGTAPGTTLVADLSVYAIGTFGNLPLAVGSRLYFSSATEHSDGRLYRSDGTTAGTVVVTHRIPGAAAVGSVGGRVLLTTMGDINTYGELWASDGTDAGTLRIFPRPPLTVITLTLTPAGGPEIPTRPTGVAIRFSAPVDPASITSATVQLVGSGGDGTFGDGNEAVVVPTGLTLTAADTATLDLSGISLADDHYRIRVAGSNAGGALHFDGSGQTVVMPNASSLNPTAELTLETWFNFAVGGNFNPRMIERDLYNIGTTGTGASRTVGVGYGLESTTVYAAGIWHHAALTIDGATTLWKLYVDGELVDTITGVALSPGSAIPLRLGRSRNAGYDNYNGLMDEVRLWSVVRTQDQIRAGMGRTLTGAETGLQGYWRCDDATGQVLTDATANANAATLGASSAVGVDDPTWVDSGAPLGVRDLAGVVLDGELSAGDPANLPSGDGTAGGDFLAGFILDTVAPAIVVTTIADGASTTALSGTTTGASSVTWALSGATAGSGTAIGTATWSFTTPTLGAGTTTVIITAHDGAGNVATASVVVTRGAGPAGTPVPPLLGHGSTGGNVCGAGSGIGVLVMMLALLAGGARLARSAAGRDRRGRPRPRW